MSPSLGSFEDAPAVFVASLMTHAMEGGYTAEDKRR